MFFFLPYFMTKFMWQLETTTFILIDSYWIFFFFFFLLQNICSSTAKILLMYDFYCY